MRTKILKGITWNKNWKYYVQSCQRDILSDYPDEKIGIIEIMSQLKDVMSVYDAYLKAIEAVFQRDNCNKNGYGLKKIKDVNYSETSYRASCFNHYCLANTKLYCQVLHNVHKRWVWLVPSLP